jgi:Domain of unknown function (DUF3327)/Putative esterase
MTLQPSRPRAPSPYPRLLGIATIAGVLTQLVLSAGAPAEGAKGERLALGKPVEREIAKGEKHVYEIDVPAGRVVNGVVDQRGVDVMLHIVDPTGATVATLDSPNGTTGPEPWSIEGKTPGTWRIQVVPFPSNLAPGRYEARVDEIITVDERDERQARLHHRSPRMLALWKERRAEGAAAVERFAREMAGHAPLVEPLAGDPGGDVLVTFARRTGPEARYVGLLGGPKPEGEAQLLRFEDTDLYTLTLRIPKDARFTYSFRLGDPPNAGATRKEVLASFAQVEADPWNPRQFPTGSSRSLVELPAAPPQTYAAHVEGVAEGRVVRKTLHSKILGENRPFSVYLPAAFDPAGGPYPYVVVFDGEVYGAAPEPLIPAPTILDNLIAQGKVPPMLAVLLDSLGSRDRDLAMSAPFGDFLAEELAPWVRGAYARRKTRPGRRSPAPASAGCARPTARSITRRSSATRSRSRGRSGSRRARWRRSPPSVSRRGP